MNNKLQMNSILNYSHIIVSNLSSSLHNYNDVLISKLNIASYNFFIEYEEDENNDRNLSVGSEIKWDISYSNDHEYSQNDRSLFDKIIFRFIQSIVLFFELDYILSDSIDSSLILFQKQENREVIYSQDNVTRPSWYELNLYDYTNINITDYKDEIYKYKPVYLCEFFANNNEIFADTNIIKSHALKCSVNNYLKTGRLKILT